MYEFSYSRAAQEFNNEYGDERMDGESFKERIKVRNCKERSQITPFLALFWSLSHLMY